MKLRSHLFVLALGTIVPVAIFAVVVAVWLVEREREAWRTGAEKRAFALLTAVDTELRAHVTTLEALASMPSLQDGNLAYFRDVAEGALKTHTDWLNVRLATPDGKPILNLRTYDSRPHGSLAADGSFARTATTGKPAISNLAWDPHLARWRFAARVAVLQQGTIRYVLSADVSPESIASIVQAQSFEPDSVGVVLDAANRFVARTWDAEKFIGKPASESLQAALAKASSGWFRGATVEGVEVYTPFHRSATTGWTVAMGVSASAFDSASWRSGWTLALGIGFSILLGFLGAYLMNRRIVSAIGSLADATTAIARGDAVKLPARVAAIDEIQTLAHALLASADAAHERQVLIEREKSALQEADRAKDRFLAMLSHELRNPLAAISAAAHVVRFARAGTAEAISAQLVIERQTRHMARLIGDLLDVSRITLGKMALEREPVDLADTITKLVSSWRASGRFGRHDVKLELAPARVNADGTRVEQIVGNLLDNALKFTPHSERVEITLGREGGEAVLRVSDSGPGIPPHLLDRLFEPFVQGNEPGTRASGGLGIGLALVKGLAEMHGGSVHAENGASGGARFTVRLPLLEPAPQLVATTERIATGGRHILLIEDDDDTRMMLHAALKYGGHEVRAARDGTSGLALAAEAHPDVAVIDLGLPDIDGLEVARRLRSTQGKRRLALVALTGFGGPDDQRRALDAGFDVHLTKPVTHERLKRVIGGFK